MKKTDTIEIKPYDKNWPNLFEKEALLIRKALKDNCLEIHHVGSTSVPGLAAKPKIDIIAVVKNLYFNKSELESIGYQDRGGINIPLRRTFTNRTTDRNINLHIFEENDPEIELNILFRNYLRENPSARDEYAKLKYNLIEEESSHQQTNSMYKGYTLSKNDFIKNILKKAGFNKHRFVLCTHSEELYAAQYFREIYFDQLGIQDPFTWTYNHKDYAHLVLYQGIEIVSYAHVQFSPNKKAIILIIITDENKRNQNFGSHFLALIEKWLKSLEIKSLYAESKENYLKFFLKNGYFKMPFDDPEHDTSDTKNIFVGKVL